MDVQSVSPSTASSIDVPGVSLSTASSMYPLSPPAVWTCRVYSSPLLAVLAGVCISFLMSECRTVRHPFSLVPEQTKIPTPVPEKGDPVRYRNAPVRDWETGAWNYRPSFRENKPKTLVFVARNYRPSFRENKPKTLIFNDWKRAFWACFRENLVYKFGHGNGMPLPAASASISMPMLSCGCYTSWPYVSVIRIMTVLLHGLSQRRRSIGKEYRRQRTKDYIVYL